MGIKKLIHNGNTKLNFWLWSITAIAHTYFWIKFSSGALRLPKIHEISPGLTEC